MGVGVGAGVARGEDPRLWVSLSLGQALGAFDSGSKPGISGPGCELRPRSLASVHQLPFHQQGHWKSSSALLQSVGLEKERLWSSNRLRKGWTGYHWGDLGWPTKHPRGWIQKEVSIMSNSAVSSVISPSEIIPVSAALST